MAITSWTSNTIMFWKDGSGALAGQFRKVTDHGRAPLSESTERIENKQRMADGTLRRYSVSKKRTWTTSWDNLPSTNTKPTGYTTADGGMAGEDIEDFLYRNDAAFDMQLRRGDGTVTTVTVMVSDYSKEVVKRGFVDLWTMDVTLEEV